MKPYYRRKGKYKNDGRARIVIEWETENGKLCNKALPKPEILLILMDGDRWKEILKEIKEEKRTG